MIGLMMRSRLHRKKRRVGFWFIVLWVYRGVRAWWLLIVSLQFYDRMNLCESKVRYDSDEIARCFAGDCLKDD